VHHPLARPRTPENRSLSAATDAAGAPGGNRTLSRTELTAGLNRSLELKKQSPDLLKKCGLELQKKNRFFWLLSSGFLLKQVLYAENKNKEGRKKSPCLGKHGKEITKARVP
jgi:hypothetical protein